MNAVEHRLAQVVKELLTTNKPEEVPEDYTIRAAHDTSKVAKPYIVAAAINGKTIHPKMRKLDLLLTSHIREGDADTTPDLEMHQRFVNVIEANLDDLITALEAVQLRLKKIISGTTTEEIENGRATASSTLWTLHLQIL
jgi:hypothetical protein